ncbi:MAG TPA: hypothetical protein VLJ37_02825 [bacterium]|nr:hypothetical protein [bacterium]
MRKSIVTGALAVSLIAAGAVAPFVPDAIARYSEKKEAKFKTMRERRLERMTENLNLNAGQQAKIKAIFDEQHAKMKALHEETHKKVLAVLTAEQKAKFEKQREERRKPD